MIIPTAAWSTSIARARWLNTLGPRKMGTTTAARYAVRMGRVNMLEKIAEVCGKMVVVVVWLLILAAMIPVALALAVIGKGEGEDDG